MKPIQTFTVSPSLPEPLQPLRKLATNLRWAWNHDTIELFRRLDSELWETSGHNPVLMLGTVDQSRLEAAAGDEGFMAHLDRVERSLEEYLQDKSTWFDRVHQLPDGSPLVAYFSAEFGVTECLAIFAGGLGVLSGDHLKSSSDLGVPLVGVGLLYQEGYFRQYLNEAGWQQEIFEENDFQTLPLIREQGQDGTPLLIEVPFPDRQVSAQIWRVQVGRVPLFLLDTNIPANPEPAYRDITDQLYGGDKELRIQQELVLGVGGMRALAALDQEPIVCHINEGHSAFLALERICRLMEREGLSYEAAREAASSSLVFTTHTPVAAGHDYFPPDLARRYLGQFARRLGIPEQELLDLGREDPGNEAAPLCMTTLALRLASHSNAVSRLHGEVTREMWQVLWPQVPVDEVPIGHVTNGVHFRSWISLEMNRLYDRYLGPRWREEPADQEVWQRAEHIAPNELWRTHERRRERLVAFARRRVRHQRAHRGAPQSQIEAADEVLDPEALTIGFSRRFATYKRATLLLRDPERLAKIVNDPDRPVQIIYAGKAHPRDEEGKKLIARIMELARQERFERRLIFLEDYDMAVTRYMVQGCDVWLNTPRRPREACGTSGMKAAANGVLNLSVLDGWWDEAYQPDVGWAIGRGETYEDPEVQDRVEAEALYDLLERDVVPLFYDRGSDDLPRRWISRMKACIGKLNYYYNTHRMVQEYTERLYLPTAQRYQQLKSEEMGPARALAEWKRRVREHWPEIEIQQVDAESLTDLRVGDEIHARAVVHLGELSPDDVTLQLTIGPVDTSGEIVEGKITALEYAGVGEAEGEHLFEANNVPCDQSGLYGYTVRVLPSHPDLVTPFLPGLITWA
jgi:starch phosphorylase